LLSEGFGGIMSKTKDVLTGCTLLERNMGAVLHVRHTAHRGRGIFSRAELASCRTSGIGNAAVKATDSDRCAWVRGNADIAHVGF
jgi:hypothetical protein